MDLVCNGYHIQKEVIVKETEEKSQNYVLPLKKGDRNHGTLKNFGAL